jgi:hypothetical protein
MVQHKQEDGQVIYLSRSKSQASTPEEPPSATRGAPCSENRRPKKIHETEQVHAQIQLISSTIRHNTPRNPLTGGPNPPRNSETPDSRTTESGLGRGAGLRGGRRIRARAEICCRAGGNELENSSRGRYSREQGKIN